MTILEDKIKFTEETKGNLTVSTKFRLDEKKIASFNKQIPMSRSERVLYELFDETKQRFVKESTFGVFNTTNLLSLATMDDDKRVVVNKTNTKAIKYAFSELWESEEDILDIVKKSRAHVTTIESVCMKLLKWCPAHASGDVGVVDFGECHDEYPKEPEPTPPATDDVVTSGDENENKANNATGDAELLNNTTTTAVDGDQAPATSTTTAPKDEL